MAVEKPKKATDAQIKRVRLQRAYKAVFGTDPNTRTSAQQLVWDDMQERSFFLRGTHRMAADQSVDTHYGQINEGKRLFFLGIVSNILSPPALEIPDLPEQ
jgi:hypothetical protein